jgi:hypothetical protein
VLVHSLLLCRSSAQVCDRGHVDLFIRKDYVQVDAAALALHSARFFFPMFELNVVNISGYMQAVQHANSVVPWDGVVVY